MSHSPAQRAPCTDQELLHPGSVVKRMGRNRVPRIVPALTQAVGKLHRAPLRPILRPQAVVDQVKPHRSGLCALELRFLNPASGHEVLPKALRASTSVFALANAITATARERSDVASRLSLESIGHRYLTARAS
jgi:hypothetical protein